MKEDEIKQFLLNQMTKQWLEDNSGLREDIDKLVMEFVVFNAKWGTKFNPVDILKNNHA